jgi:hypothetical protein
VLLVVVFGPLVVVVVAVVMDVGHYKLCGIAQRLIVLVIAVVPPSLSKMSVHQEFFAKLERRIV